MKTRINNSYLLIQDYENSEEELVNRICKFIQCIAKQNNYRFIISGTISIREATIDEKKYRCNKYYAECPVLFLEEYISQAEEYELFTTDIGQFVTRLRKDTLI